MSAARRSTILVIDDSAFSRSLVLMKLRDTHDVVMAESGATGLAEFRARRPDLVILDLLMPDLGGFEFLRMALEEWPDARILVCSADCDEEVEQRVLAAGAVGFLRKTDLLTEGRLVAAVGASLQPMLS